MNTEQTSPPDSLGSPSGYASFADLCETLIEEEGHHWLHPVIYRTRPTDWVAEIHTRPLSDERTEKLASGQMGTMEEACAAAVEDFHERARIRARKEELLTDPNVQEALKLFGRNETSAGTDAGAPRS
jgi:hypothetical protein